MARAKTFYDDRTIEVEIVGRLADMFKVRMLPLEQAKQDIILVRRAANLEPLDDEAREILK